MCPDGTWTVQSMWRRLELKASVNGWEKGAENDFLSVNAAIKFTRLRTVLLSVVVFRALD